MTKEDPSGLLSKVVRFVTSPTTNWGDLNQPEEDRDSLYNKQALKEMIERKRRNDFVRRREFDQLRKLRKREALNPPVDPARPSFFQSSLASRIEDRAGTLKKIDEIEAQMSMQWWRAKQGQPPPGAAAAVSPNAFAPTRPLGMDSAAAPLAAEGSPTPTPAAPRGKPQVAPSDAMPLSMPSSTVSTSMLRNLTTQPGTHFPAFAPHGGAGPGPFRAHRFQRDTALAARVAGLRAPARARRGRHPVRQWRFRGGRVGPAGIAAPAQSDPARAPVDGLVRSVPIHRSAGSFRQLSHRLCRYLRQVRPLVGALVGRGRTGAPAQL